MPLINYISNRQECLGTAARRGTAPPPIFLDYLVVGGGGTGSVGGPGGGGGVVSGSIRLLPRFTMDVTVGSGGIATASVSPGTSSLFIQSSDFAVFAGSGSTYYSGYPQLNGPGSQSSNYSGPGAGGSSAIGGNDTNNGATGGNGGSGSLWMNGQYYGGGGGGFGAWFIPGDARGGQGGVGGGGAGAGFTNTAESGAVNTGGGAGGGGVVNGGSGIAILRYNSGSVMGATGGTVEITGSNVYHIFTGSGQFIYQP